MNNELELVVETQALLGECPCWDHHKQLLYWVDILNKQLHIYSPQNNTDRIIQLEEYVSCVVPRSSGGVVLGLATGFAALDLDSETVKFLAKPENHPPTNRFNDGKCDPAGRFLAGTMDFEQRENAGFLYTLESNLQIKQLLDHTTVANGMGWSPDYSTLYFIDSPTQTIFAFDYDLDQGTIKNRREAIKIPDGEGFPDGMTTDLEGMIWVALWAGAKVMRWNPNTGELLQTIPIPARNVTSCTFGGQNMNELYITTARQDMNEDDFQKYPQTGSLFKLKTDVVGMTNFEFRG
ncbi:SMP-30/Gluconolaconase/LRE domain protein [Gloeothece citriformis PCC 7424]|uniref:Regucalcin n=2 Tax=Gloeothece TaxID=28070 RepID=B7K848_GLOC7|nr:SMP-30/Gluconolaconase/LRE domain protein [Gloeothece citriformis PCC 7424]